MENSENKNKLLKMVTAIGTDLACKTEEITGIDNYTTEVKITITCDTVKPPIIKVDKKTVSMAGYEAQQEQDLVGGSL